MTESDLPFAACKHGIFLKSFGLFSRFWYALFEINEHSAPLSIKVRYFCFPILNTQELGFPAKLILKTGFLDSLFLSPPASSWKEPTSFPDIGLFLLYDKRVFVSYHLWTFFDSADVNDLLSGNSNTQHF